MPQVYISGSDASRIKMANFIRNRPTSPQTAVRMVEDNADVCKIDQDPPGQLKLSKKSVHFWKG